MEIIEEETKIVPVMKYVAFCDVLGFANAVQDRFEETMDIYEQFAQLMKNWPISDQVEVCVYSDSILIVSDELGPLLTTVQNLSFATLANNLLIRGGVAYGKYWERKEKGNLYVVSDALVRAVKLESNIKIPGVGFSSEVELPIQAWLPHFYESVFTSPVLHFRGINVVNPFNHFWFASAKNRVAMMLERFPEHSAKYEWFLDLAASIDNSDLMVPQQVVDQLLAEGVIERRKSEENELIEDI